MRYERKYRIEPADVKWVEQVVSMHPASFQKAFPNRQVNNIYFDTTSLTTFHENQSGIANRKKYRIRWYGRFLQVINQPILEVKIKENLLGYKKHFKLDHSALGLLPELKQQVNKTLDLRQELLPVLLSAYQRSYWATPDNKIRLTIDWEMNFHHLLQQTTFEKFQMKDPAIIVELKYHESQETRATEIMQYLPFRITKNSKYVQGMEMMLV